MEQLFLLEILVDTIYFKSSLNVPQKKQINVVATFANITSLEIRNDGLGGVEESSKSSDVDFSSGKSYLFPCSVDKLLKALSDYPLQIAVGTKNSLTPIGVALINWSSDFVQMVDSCSDNVGYITPVSQRDIHPMKDGNGVETGNVEVFVRLSCFGKNIQTQFQVVHSKEKDGTLKTQFLFKNTNAATTFQCQRFGLGTSAENIPIGAVYNTAELDDRTLKQFFSMDFDTGGVPGSAMPSAFNIEQLFQQRFSKSVPDDQLSIMFRLDNNKFFNLAEICGSAPITDDELTIENINKMLCKDRDCPGVKKFKDYGIGPLATGTGLGTLYGDVDPPVLYGMSHANGTMENYGPYGVYRKPKRPDQKFMPRKTSSSSSSKSSTSSKSSRSSKRSSCSCQNDVLRLTGGAPIEGEDKEKKGGVSPLHACRSLMDNFDKLLDAYKRALGPCGHATCPFARNLIEESCKAYCPNDPQGMSGQQLLMPAQRLADSKAPDAGSMSSCGASTCPYAREMIQPVEPEVKLKQLVPACGDSTCPYARKRLGILDEDTDEVTIQLATLPKNCGAPSCPYRVEQQLPPIHWDCPDPLPKGRCKNAHCPILKAQGFVNQTFQCPQSPCQAPKCPYAIPPPCDYPGCPFGAPKPCNVPGCPFSEAPPCYDSNCPNNRVQLSESASVCSNPACPFYKPSVPNTSCSDPTCPYTEIMGKQAASARSVGDSGAGDGKNVRRISGQEDGPAPQESEDLRDVEVISGDNIESCTPNTCKAKNGDLECDTCTPGGGRKSGEVDEPKEGDIELVRGDNIESCTPHSCLATGGDLLCLECPCSVPLQDQGSPLKQPVISSERPTRRIMPTGTGARKGKKRKRKGRYLLDTGDTYPGVKIGHRYCVTPALNVPHNMGWLWNIKPVGRLKPRRGWKPGALTKQMMEVIEKHRAIAGVKPLIPPTPKPSKRRMRKNAYGVYESDSDVTVAPKPTLQIKKKDGCYYITMNPLKDPHTLEENENPYIDCTPMQFKITKNKALEQIKPGEEENSFCCCDDDDEHSSSSDSELDIEFTPPAGIIHPDRLRKRKNVVHQDTQYCVEDVAKAADTLQLGEKKPGGGGKKGKGKGKGKKGGKGKGGKKGKKK